MLPGKNAAEEEAGGDAKRRREGGDPDASAHSEVEETPVEEVDSEIEKMTRMMKRGRADSDSDPEKAAAQKKKEGESSSDSSSSSSSSTTSSSSSESEEEDDAAAELPLEAFRQEGDEDEDEEEVIAELSPADRLKRDLEACRGVQLKRKEIIWMLHTLPHEEASRAIKRSWVRITLQVGVCVLAQITDLVEEQPYNVDGGKMHMGTQEPCTVKVSLRCRRCMPPEKTYKLIYISNQEVTSKEFEQWQKLVTHHGIDLAHYRANWADKNREIRQARGFKFEESVVSKMLRRKTEMGVDVEFDAQKESRMRSNIQSATSQMELCGLRENRAAELEDRFDQATTTVDLLLQKSAKHQEEWFEKRANLYSLKEINVKNKDRQTARDKHALEYTYAMEAEDEEAIKAGKIVTSNPFERRACRPVSAWDTKLTHTDGIDGQVKEKKKKEAPKEAAPVAAQDSAGTSSQKAKVSRVDMRAHRHLWSLLSGEKGAPFKASPDLTSPALVPATGT